MDPGYIGYGTNQYTYKHKQVKVEELDGTK
jgi:hypothetical protein